MPQRLKRFILLIGLCVGILAIALGGPAQKVEARPRYLKVWKDVYPDRDVSNAKCAICHVGEKKTTHTEYGEAVKEALGAKNVMDDEAIKAALKKAEGKLPPKKP